MGNTKAKHVDELIIAVRRYARHSSAEEIAALAAAPAVVTSALAAASSTLGVVRPPGEGAPETIGGPPAALVDARLDARTRSVRVEGLLGSEEVARRIGVKNRQSVHQQLKKGQLIGFEGAKRGAMFPRGQFDERGRTVPGIAEVRACFPDGYSAWVWLTTPSAALGDRKPLERLREGDKLQRALRGRDGTLQFLGSRRSRPFRPP